MKLLGIICYAFAVIDLVTYFVGLDITGVWWSPIVAAVLGRVFMNMAKKQEAESTQESAMAAAARQAEMRANRGGPTQ